MGYVPICCFYCLTESGYVSHQRRDDAALIGLEVALVFDGKAELVNDENTFDSLAASSEKANKRKLV